MMIPKNFENKEIGLLGLGVSGKSAFKSLKAGGGNIYAYDDNISNDPIVIEPDKWPWEKLNKIVVSPGISLNHPVIKKAESFKVDIINEIDVFANSKPKAKVIGVTGTNGKSTTSALLGHILNLNGFKTKVGGNIGEAATSIDDPGEDGFIILELSSFQLETCSDLELDGAILLNITPDHLDWHGNLNNYFNSKLKIGTFLKEDAPIVVSNTNNLTKKACELFYKNKIKVIEVLKNDISHLQTILENKFYNENHLTIIQLLKEFGVKKERSIEAIKSFNELPHRLEFCYQKNNITFINDSKATNAEATINALEKYRNIYWIAGGIGKTDGVKATLKHLKNVNKCYLIGKSKKDFFETLNSKIDCTISDNLSKALKEIFKETLNKSNEITVLLSPAASSFDQFLNFESRGNAFKSLISEIWEL